MTRSIKVNGDARRVRAETVEQLLDELQVRPERSGIAIALNGSIVPRSDWQRCTLNADDLVEIVGAMQGG